MKELDALRTIGEVSQIINVPVYVIRFWEKKFDSIKPIKRKGGNRYFDKNQISNLIIIKKLLHEDKYSIQGAKKVLMKNNFVEKEKQILVKEIKQLINKIKVLVYYNDILIKEEKWNGGKLINTIEYAKVSDIYIIEN